MARPRFVVDVVKNETSASSPTATQLPVQPSSPPPTPKHRVYLPQVVQDSFDEGEARLKRMFQEDQLELARAESPSLQKPRTPGRTATVQEQAFLQQPIQKPLSKIERVYQQQYKDEVPVENVKKRSYKNIFSKIPRAPQLPKWQYWAIGLIGGVVLMVGSSVLFIRWQIDQTREQTLLLVEDLRQGRMTSARERLESLRGTYTQASTLYSLGRGAVLLTQGQEKTNHIDGLFELGQSGLRIADTGLAAYDNIEKGYKQFVGSDPGESLPTFQATAGQLEGLYTDLSHFQAQVEQLQNPYDREEIELLKEKVRADVPTIRRFLLAGQQLNTILPTLLGEDEKKEYLVLLQNNQELRPTGGFIGSFALLTVEKGKLLDFKVEDVYEADGQLKGYVTPPPEIVQYLGEAQWHLRDVNWSPDFPTVAQQAGWFLDKTIGVQPDGVIGINLYVAQKLLAVTGPIELVDYKEVVTQENLYHLAHRHSEINFSCRR